VRHVRMPPPNSNRPVDVLDIDLTAVRLPTSCTQLLAALCDAGGPRMR
jgi:hypothetical protein